MSPDEGQEEYDEVQAELRKNDEEVTVIKYLKPNLISMSLCQHCS